MHQVPEPSTVKHDAQTDLAERLEIEVREGAMSGHQRYGFGCPAIPLTRRPPNEAMRGKFRIGVQGIVNPSFRATRPE